MIKQRYQLVIADLAGIDRETGEERVVCRGMPSIDEGFGYRLVVEA